MLSSVKRRRKHRIVVDVFGTDEVRQLQADLERVTRQRDDAMRLLARTKASIRLDAKDIDTLTRQIEGD